MTMIYYRVLTCVWEWNNNDDGDDNDLLSCINVCENEIIMTMVMTMIYYRVLTCVRMK